MPYFTLHTDRQYTKTLGEQFGSVELLAQRGGKTLRLELAVSPTVLSQYLERTLHGEYEC